jgi:hypothetical protein
MTQTILAIFDMPNEALATVRALRREGIAQVEMLSAEPLHDAIAEEDTQSRIGIFAVLGAVLGAGSALLLTVYTSRHVAIITGGMPIVTPWAFGIVIFEVAMFCAILAALIRMIFEAQLARGYAMSAYDEAVGDNKTVLAISCADEDLLDKAEKLLAETSAQIKQKA